MKKIFTALSLFVVLQSVSAQVGIGTLTPHTSAQLDVSSTTKGLLIPRMTQSQRNTILTPVNAAGLLIYQTDGTPGFYYWTGSSWQIVGSTNGWGLNGNSITTNTNFIGTTNDQPLNFKVNNTAAGQIANEWVGNTAFGISALASNTTGTSNTAIGISALRYSKGNKNTALGAYAGPSSAFPDLTNTTAIGFGATVVKSNSLVLGGIGSDAVDVGIGVTAPYHTLDIFTNSSLDKAHLRLHEDDADFARLRMTNGVGVNFWDMAGRPALTNEDASNASLNFYYSGQGYVLSLKGNGNVGIGTVTPHASALLDMASDTKGLLIPRVPAAKRPTPNAAADGLLIYQTDGAARGFNYWDGNTATWKSLGGASSGWGLNGNSITTNTNFIGTTNDQPLNFKVNNTAAGQIANSVVRNTAFGISALASNTTGTSNTAIGARALTINTSGSNNTALGVDAGPGSGFTGLSNTTAIGYNAKVTQSNSLILGGTGSDAVQVGIGTTAPAHLLDIRTNSTQDKAQLRLHEEEADFARLKMTNTASVNYWDIAGRPSTTNADASLNFYYSGLGDVLSLKGDGNGTLRGILNQNSDQRLKRDIQPITLALKKVQQLNGYHYYWKDSQRDQGLQIGVIAQELQKVLPELVKSDDKGILSVNYTGLAPILIEAVKEQQTIIDDQNKRIEQLEKQLVEILQKLK